LEQQQQLRSRRSSNTGALTSRRVNGYEVLNVNEDEEEEDEEESKGNIVKTDKLKTFLIF